MDYLNKPEINITTIEDPVEIRINGLNQIEIDAKPSFSDSLRTVLRQDPDIILVGEIEIKKQQKLQCKQDKQDIMYYLQYTQSIV